MVNVSASFHELAETIPYVQVEHANDCQGPLKANPTASFDESSIVHERTPLDPFRVQIQELCRSMWPASPETPMKGLPAGFSGRLRRLLRRRKQETACELPPPPERFNVQYLESGTYDKIISVVMPNADVDSPLRLILRTPNDGCEAHLRRDIAALRYLRKFTPIPVAEIIASNFSIDNPLQRPYAFESRIPGYNLRQVYSDLLQEHLYMVSREVGKIYHALQSVNGRVPGYIELISSDDQTFAIRPFDIKSPANRDRRLEFKDPISWNPNHHDKLYGTTVDMLITQFGRWRAHELLENPSKIKSQNYYHRLVEVAQDMNRLGIFNSNENCLCHLDLSARNIMIDIPPSDGPLTISGLLGWDNAIFAPRFVGCTLPSWLWTDMLGSNPMIRNRQEDGGATGIPTSPNQEKIKRIFEGTVGEEYLRYACEPRYQLARRLFFFALDGIQRNEDIVAVDRLLKDWKAFYDDLVPQSKSIVRVESEVSSLDTSTHDGDVSPLTGEPEGRLSPKKDSASYFRRISYKPSTEKDLEAEFTDELRVRFGKRQSLAWSKI